MLSSLLASLALYIAVPAGLAYCCWSYYSSLNYWRKKSVPGPTPLPFFGNLLSFVRKPIKVIDSDLVNQYGPLVGIMEGSSPVLMVSQQDMIDEVFVRNFSVFSDNKSYFFHPILSKGLVTRNGKEWKRARKIIGSGFTPYKLKPMNSSITACLNSLCVYVDQQLETGNSDFELNDVISMFMVDVVSKVFFAVDVNVYEENNVFFKNAKWSMQFPALKILMFAFLPESVLSYMNFTVSPYMPTAFLLHLSRKILKERRAADSSIQFYDFVQILQDARGDDGSALDEDEILGNMVQFFMAGFDTTSSSLAAAFHCLAVHPHEQEVVRQEVVENGSDDYDKDSYIYAFVQEVLRLFPAVTRFDRVASCDATLFLDGKKVKIEKGTKARLPVYRFNRSPEYFKDAETFDPSRFMPSGSARNQRIFTFAAGSRNCIGENFARLVMNIALTHMLKLYRFKRSVKTEDPMDFSSSHFNLHPRTNVVAMEHV